MSFKKSINKSIALALVGVTISAPLSSSVNAMQKSDKKDLEQSIVEGNITEIESLMKKSIDMDAEIKEKVLSKGYSSVEEYNELIGKAILAGASAQIGANIVNDTREIMKNGLPKVSTHSSSSVVGYGAVTSGDKVRLAQTLLKQHGYDVVVDGIWGPKSEAATKSFQRKLNMTADGVIGKHTWAYLIEHLK